MNSYIGIASLKQIPKNIWGKRVFLRVDFNMPYEGNKFLDTFRFEKTLPTIKLLQKGGAKVVLASHFEVDNNYPSFKKFEKIFASKIKNFYFAGAAAGKNLAKKTKALSSGDVLMLENLRLDLGEKENSPAFARKLSKLADVYVNEAFSVSHRAHASIAGITEFLPSYAGPLFVEETKNLSRAFKPPKPFLLILGGKKLETKMPLLKKFAPKADKIFIGGKAANLLLQGKLKNLKKFIPILDVYIKKEGKKTLIDVKSLRNEPIYDIGPKTIKSAEKFIHKSKFVLWNGPFGLIEDGFTKGTLDLARLLAMSRAETIVGGGDTVAFLRKHKLDKKFSFVSTGGGAMLEFLAKGTLPGIAALEKSMHRQRREALKK